MISYKQSIFSYGSIAWNSRSRSQYSFHSRSKGILSINFPPVHILLPLLVRLQCGHSRRGIWIVPLYQDCSPETPETYQIPFPVHRPASRSKPTSDQRPFPLAFRPLGRASLFNPQSHNNMHTCTHCQRESLIISRCLGKKTLRTCTV